MTFFVRATMVTAFEHLYDAIYLELAKRNVAPIATLDRALARAAASEGLRTF